MRTVYSSTCPSLHDTPAISKAKWAQVAAGDVRSHRTDRSIHYSISDPDSHDTKNIVLGKILQSNCDAGSTQEVSASAVVNFDGSEITLSWSQPAGTYPSSAGYAIYRNGILIANVALGTNSYTDTTVESGQTYTYSVLFHPS